MLQFTVTLGVIEGYSPASPAGLFALSRPAARGLIRSSGHGIMAPGERGPQRPAIDPIAGDTIMAKLAIKTETKTRIASTQTGYDLTTIAAALAVMDHSGCFETLRLANERLRQLNVRQDGSSKWTYGEILSYTRDGERRCGVFIGGGKTAKVWELGQRPLAYYRMSWHILVRLPKTEVVPTVQTAKTTLRFPTERGMAHTADWVAEFMLKDMLKEKGGKSKAGKAKATAPAFKPQVGEALEALCADGEWYASTLKKITKVGYRVEWAEGGIEVVAEVRRAR